MVTAQFAPLLVALFVIIYLVVTQPLGSQLAGISMNWIAVIVVAIGGLLGFAQ